MFLYQLRIHAEVYIEEMVRLSLYIRESCPSISNAKFGIESCNWQIIAFMEKDWIEKSGPEILLIKCGPS